jgi:RNA polymerase sigma-70 factor (ECF subfamily)
MWQDQQQAAQLFQRYTGRLIALARQRLPAQLSHRIDAEDVVQSVYRSFFAATPETPATAQPECDLWQLLVTITLNKVHDQVRRHTSDKRSAERDRHYGSEDSLLGLQQGLYAREPTPVEAVALVEQLEHQMRGLKPLARRMVELRLQGYELEEIATLTERSQRTVIRVLADFKRQLEPGHA